MAFLSNDSRAHRWLVALWRPFAETPAGRFAADTYLAVRGVVHGFRGENINLRAGYLTYVSVFSLVPLVTVGLAILQSLHQESIRRRLSGFVHELLAPGIQRESAAFLDRLVNSAGSRAAGGVGFFFLLLSAGTLLRHLDASLNEIWAVRRARPWWLSLLLYAGALFFGPLLLGVWLLGTATIRELLSKAGLPFSAQALSLGSAALSVLVLTLLYRLAPHAPVRLRSALAGGLVAGVCWELARILYSRFATLIFKASPLYGSLSAVPLFLMWIYLGWLVLLLGARLSYAVEQASFRGVLLDLIHHPRTKELLAARIAQLSAAAHLAGGAFPTTSSLARTLQAPEQLLDEVVRLLKDAGVLVVGLRGELRPSREPSKLTLAEVSSAVGGVPSLMRPRFPSKGEGFRAVEGIFGEVDEASATRLAAVTWEQLARQLDAPDRELAKMLRSPAGL